MRFRVLLLSLAMILTVGRAMPLAAVEAQYVTAGSLVMQNLTYNNISSSVYIPAGSDDTREKEKPKSDEEPVENSLITGEGAFDSSVSYPETGIAEVDESVIYWTDLTYKGALEQYERLTEKMPYASANLVIDYNSYTVDDRVLSVELYGTFSYTGLEHPLELLRVINADVYSGELLDSSELFPEQESVLTMMKQELLQSNPLLDSYLQQMNSSWLDTAIITPDGVEFLFPCGTYLPYNFGTMRVFLDNNRLEGLLELPCSEYFVPRRNLDPSKPMVALTFDDGPCDNTLKILSLLEQYGGKATFCVVGNRIDSYPDVVSDIAEQGSEIVGHSWAHSQLTNLSESAVVLDIEMTQDAIYEAAGVKPLMVRAPYGSFNGTVRSAMSEKGMALLQWSVDSLDWKTQSARSTYDIIMDNVKDGSVILCHDLWSATGVAMEYVIPQLIDKGYQLVTISELMYYKDITVEPGLVYYSGY